MGSQTNDNFSLCYNVDTNKLIQDGFPVLKLSAYFVSIRVS